MVFLGAHGATFALSRTAFAVFVHKNVLKSPEDMHSLVPQFALQQYDEMKESISWITLEKRLQVAVRFA